MNSNIFQGAKFGDKFLTRDGRVAILRWIHKGNDIIDEVKLITPTDDIIVNKNGHFCKKVMMEHKNDIVSKYQEPINEDELDKLAKEYEKNVKALCDFHKIEPSLKGAYKAGFKKAMEK